MVLIWDYFMRRKGVLLLATLLLITVVVLGNLFLPKTDPGISITQVAPLTATVLTPAEVTEYSAEISVPRTGEIALDTVPGVFVDLDTASDLAGSSFTYLASTNSAVLADWHSIIASATGILIFAVVVVVFARYLC